MEPESRKPKPLPSLPYLVNLIFFLSDREREAARIAKLVPQKTNNREPFSSPLSLQNRGDPLV